MRKVHPTVLLTLAALFILSACNLPKATATPQSNEQDAVRTAAAQTVEALGTELASTPTFTSQASPVKPTAIQPTNAQVTATQEPTLAVVATNTPFTLAPSPTATGICDAAKFVGETIKDGSSYASGATFTKSWTLQNNGTCSWDTNYALVFISGDSMNGVASKPLTTGKVAPGDSIQITVDLTAPNKPGTFHGNWGVRNPAGIIFSKFWVEINVPVTTYSFIDNMCKAQWRSAPGVLPCPGTTADANGFVLKVDNPKLDGGYQDNEPALETAPQSANNGYISGTYPAISITAGSHFKAVIGCLSGSVNCNVKFSLFYIADGGSQTTWKEWTKTNDGKFISIDEDLTPLAGKSVQFIFQVTANGTGSQTNTYWLLPRIQ